MQNRQQDRQQNSQTISLHATQLLVRYGALTALKIPNLTIQGKIIAIIGHNGSGKSTLLKTILELISPVQGDVAAVLSEGGTSTRLVPEQHMAFSQENGGIFGDITVEEYLKLWCRIKHRNAKYYLTANRELLEELEIPPLYKKLGRQLSKGQRHRVQAAIGFLIQPKLFIFDEPFDGLDIGQSIQLARVMQKKSEEMTMILSSHRMEVVERLADQVIVLQDGYVRANGSIAEVCEAISGVTLSVQFCQHNTLHSLDIAQRLRSSFKHSLVQLIGDQLAITGTHITKESVTEFLQEKQVENLKVQTITPSLVDAMQYHLQTLHG